MRGKIKPRQSRESSSMPHRLAVRKSPAPAGQNLTANSIEAWRAPATVFARVIIEVDGEKRPACLADTVMLYVQ
jgi:hypothetical protein